MGPAGRRDTLAGCEPDQLAEARRAPFAVYGLTADFVGPRTLGGIGHRGDAVNLVALSHGDRQGPPRLWAQVTVMGPLHGGAATRAKRWSIDPLPMIATELLNTAGTRLDTAAALRHAVEGVLAGACTDIHIELDGQPKSFRTQTVRQPLGGPARP